MTRRASTVRIRRDDTRERRVAEALELLREGKPRR
jgi:hypothetical protein